MDVPRGARAEPRRDAAREGVQPAALVLPVKADALQLLAAIAREIEACRACQLGTCRTRTVPGQGSAKARLLFVGDAPGEEEDRQGDAFVGEAGQLLSRMIVAMGLAREDVFITNVLKCRPPDDRDPAADEMAACSPFLLRQIAALDPDVIVTLGAHATRHLLQRDGPLGKMRGLRQLFGRAELVVTYHPAYLLRSPGMKREAWEDLKRAKVLLDGARRP